MIDISKLNDKTFDVKLTDGRVLNIRKPNKEIFNDTMKVANLVDSDDKAEGKIVNAVYDFLTKVFNRNKNHIGLTKEELEEELDFVNAMIVIKAYQEFVSEVIQNTSF